MNDMVSLIIYLLSFIYDNQIKTKALTLSKYLYLAILILFIVPKDALK
jgi:hypothetical protein